MNVSKWNIYDFQIIEYLNKGLQYNKIAKQNRVYVKGELIGKIWSKNETYYFDENTGRYLKNKPVYEFVNDIEDFTPKHNYKIILSDDIDIAIDLETGEVVEPPREVFPNQILNHTKLVVE